MNKKITALAVACAAVTAMPAFAQTAAPAAAPAAPTPLRHGTPVPGLCVFSGEAAIGASQVGKFVAERLAQLDAPSEAELTSMNDAWEKSVEAFNAARATLTPEAANQQATELNQRRAQIQQLLQVRSRESQLTSTKALERINTEMSPLVTQTYQERNCSVLFDGNAIIAAAPASDLTGEVVRLLDAKLTQFTFERERLDTGAAAAPAAAPARR